MEENERRNEIHMREFIKRRIDETKTRSRRKRQEARSKKEGEEGREEGREAEGRGKQEYELRVISH